MKVFRSGPFGGIMDEYERAAKEYMAVIVTIPQLQWETMADPQSPDPDCRSIQLVTNHVIRAGFGYANMIRRKFRNAFKERKERYDVQSPQTAISEMEAMLIYTEETLKDKWDMKFEDVVNNTFMSGWGQEYDAEQILEHAIVHVLRHRRQVERLLLKLQSR